MFERQREDGEKKVGEAQESENRSKGFKPIKRVESIRLHGAQNAGCFHPLQSVRNNNFFIWIQRHCLRAGSTEGISGTATTPTNTVPLDWRARGKDTAMNTEKNPLRLSWEL